jgi:hypothetical protein
MNPEQIKAGIGTITAVGDAIHQFQSIPSGHLYAHLCGHLSIDSYQEIIDILQKAGRIRVEPSFLIICTCPKNHSKENN